MSARGLANAKLEKINASRAQEKPERTPRELMRSPGEAQKDAKRPPRKPARAQREPKKTARAPEESTRELANAKLVKISAERAQGGPPGSPGGAQDSATATQEQLGDAPGQPKTTLRKPKTAKLRPRKTPRAPEDRSTRAQQGLRRRCWQNQCQENPQREQKNTACPRDGPQRNPAAPTADLKRTPSGCKYLTGNACD